MKYALVFLLGLGVIGGLNWPRDRARFGEEHASLPNDSRVANQAVDADTSSATSRSAISPGSQETLDQKIRPVAMPPHSFATPHGQGLEAWQAFYRDFPRENGLLDFGAPGFAWWFEDPEMVALFESSFDAQIPIMMQEFAERRSRENDLSQVDPGSRAFESNLLRYHEEIEQLGFQADWFRVQEPRSDVARHLSNFLVHQARAETSGKQYDFQGLPRYRFNTPLEQVVERAAGLNLREMSSGRVNSLVDSYANVLLQAAELRSQMQVYEAARFQAARELGLVNFPHNHPSAPFCDEVMSFRGDLDRLWSSFVAEVRQDD